MIAMQFEITDKAAILLAKEFYDALADGYPVDGALAEALLGCGGLPLHLAGHLRAEEWNGAVSPGFIIADAAAG